MKSILVVDDEPTLVATLKYNLEREQYKVITARDGASAIDLARAAAPDLIILDLMLPEMDGFEVCRVLRKSLSVPILMLTAKGTEVDKVVGLELGADDYVTKPFGMSELMARVRALLRRIQKPVAADETLVSGDLRVDLARRQAFKNGQPLPLKPKEFDLLGFFLKHMGRVFSRDQLLSQIWGYDFAGDSRTVDVHVRWLRLKVEEDPADPRRLVTVRGAGYRFDR
ncbi:MAG: response regulator transcription factor [Chloroflexi bacterium]|nr:MAG: response regulator transcription factor [Chloroflexota bacterium]